MKNFSLIKTYGGWGGTTFSTNRSVTYLIISLIE